MSLIRINRHPSAKELRLFAALWLVFLSGFGSFALSRGSLTSAWVLFIAAGAVGIVGLVRPSAVRLVYIGAVYAAFPIGFVVSHIILALVYFVVVTPIGLVMRAFGKDPLHRKFESSEKLPSYWISRKEPRDAASYFKQY